MSYQKITLGEMKTLAAARMGNASFWTGTELGLYINEAIRIWNVLTGYWNSRQILPTVNNTTLYSTSLTSATVTDQNLLNETQYHLMETADNGASLDSDIWTTTEWINALNNRYREFLGRSALVLNNTTLVTVSQQSRYNLNSVDADMIDIVRLAWLDINGFSNGLDRVDEFQYNRLLNTWPYTFDTPSAYTILSQPTMILDLIPAPNDIGTLDFSYTSVGTDLSNTGVVLVVPNDFTPYIKWGLIADLLKKEGQSHDPIRAEYAEMRFREGYILGLQAPAGWLHRGVWLNEQPMASTSLHSLDKGQHGWQADTGTPDIWFPYGLTQFGVYPKNTTGTNSILIEGVTDAPVLTADGQYIDIGSWQLAALLDYVQHIASFKQAGGEFQATIPLYKRFIDAAQIQNSKLQLNGRFRDYDGKDLDGFLHPLWLPQERSE